MKFWLLIFLLTSQLALADLGHKPTMSFDFKDGIPGKVTASSGVLLESQQADGSKATPLAAVGPQRFTCDQRGCFAMAYGFAPYHRLEIKFSDGKTRRSNVFPTAGIDSKYTVTIRANDLLVESK